MIAAADASDDVGRRRAELGKELSASFPNRMRAVVGLDDLSARNGESGTPASLVRGVADFFALRGFTLPDGFDAYVSGRVPVGSGLSSSAAFEVLIAAVVNGLFFGGGIIPELLARAGQYAENTHFRKPCGLMDQLASAAGGVLGIDFKDPDAPRMTRLSVAPEDFGYELCVVDTGAGHDNLGGEYAAVPDEMAAVAERLNARARRDVAPARFYDALPALRRQVSDRALLRAMHYFGENERAAAGLDALESGDFHAFLRLARESGESSWTLLQNIYPAASVQDQPAALALAWCRRLLGEDGACRIHGGGFGGTLLAFVPLGARQCFSQDMERLTGDGSCRFLKSGKRAPWN